MSFSLKDKLGKLQALQLGSTTITDRLPIIVTDKNNLNYYYDSNMGNCDKNYCNDIGDETIKNKCNELLNQSLCKAMGKTDCKSISDIVDNYIDDNVDSNAQRQILEATLKQRLCGEVTAMITDKKEEVIVKKEVDYELQKIIEDKSQNIYQIYYYLFDNLGFTYSNEGLREDDNNWFNAVLIMFIILVILFVIGLKNIHYLIFYQNKVIGIAYLISIILITAVVTGYIQNNIIFKYRDNLRKKEQDKEEYKTMISVYGEEMSIIEIYCISLLVIIGVTLLFYGLLNFANNDSIFSLKNQTISLGLLLILSFLISTSLFNIMYLTKTMFILTLLSIIINLVLLCNSTLNISKYIVYILSFFIFIFIAIKLVSGWQISQIFGKEINKYDVPLSEPSYNLALIPFAILALITIVLFVKMLLTKNFRELGQTPVDIFNIFGLDYFTRIIY